MLKTIANKIANLTPNQQLDQARRSAAIAGLMMLAMAILTSIAHFGILGGLHQGGLQSTLENITNLQIEVIFAIILLTTAVVLDGIVAISLIKFLKPTKQKLVALMGWTRLAYAAIFLVAISFLVAMVLKVEGAIGVVSATALADLNGFNIVWDIALVMLGIHLTLLGWILYKAKYTPNWLGIIVIIAGLGYITNSFGLYLIEIYTFDVSAIAFISEVVLLIWLLGWGRHLKNSDFKKK